MVEHLSLEQKVAGLSLVWSRTLCAAVVIRTFRVQIPGRTELSPVGPMVRHLTTEFITDLSSGIGLCVQL